MAVGLFSLVAASGIAGAGTHTVKPGETASSIAAANGTTVEALAAANGLRDADLVVAGTTLVIPGGTAAAPAATSSYTVKPGDTLSTIAALTGQSIDALAQANGIENPHKIVVGRILKIALAASDIAPAAPTTSPYRVVAGDTVTSIATKAGTTAAAIMSANGLKDANVVVLGSTLQIPAAASGANSGPVFAPNGLPQRLVNHPERLALRPTFEQWAAAYGVPADLLEAMAWMESGWQNGVVSSTGAMGIGQLMPETVAFVQLIVGDHTLNPKVAEDNIQMSARFLKYLLDQTGWDAGTALAAYYQGLQSVRARPLYEDTKQYVAVILALRPHFA